MHADKISLKEVGFLASIQEKLGGPFLNYEYERGHITKLNLGYLKLKILPDSLIKLISNLRYLTELRIYHNKLTTLPESIGNLKSLQTLYLDHNELTTLPESIGDLISLQKLSLNSNKLMTLPGSIGKLTSLQTLELRYNPLIGKPDSSTKSILKKLKKNGVEIK
ncbi:hypothetical protein ES708_20538 [subsurface metagenome]